MKPTIQQIASERRLIAQGYRFVVWAIGGIALYVRNVTETKIESREILPDGAIV
jgi:hypothetical protein